MTPIFPTTRLSRRHRLADIARPSTVGLIGLSLMIAAGADLRAESMDCLIQPHEVIKVGSAVPGVLETISVERGDRIKRGQPLAQLRNEVERAALKLAQARARGNAESAAADRSSKFAVRELERANELASDSFVSSTYVDKAATEAALARTQVDKAKERKRLAEIELDVAIAQLNQRTIRSPIDGVVVDRYLSIGEYVDDRPVLRVAQVDPLRVEVVVPAERFGLITLGQTAQVEPAFAGSGQRTATVSVIDQVVDAASNTFRVRLSLPNPEGDLPAGLRCKIELNARGDDAAPAPARSPAAKG